MSPLEEVQVWNVALSKRSGVSYNINYLSGNGAHWLAEKWNKQISGAESLVSTQSKKIIHLQQWGKALLSVCSAGRHVRWVDRNPQTQLSVHLSVQARLFSHPWPSSTTFGQLAGGQSNFFSFYKKSFSHTVDISVLRKVSFQYKLRDGKSQHLAVNHWCWSTTS